MQRIVTWVLVALLIFAGIVMAGSYVARRLAPARLHGEAERWLSEWLDAPVVIDSVRPGFHRGLGLELSGLRSKEQAERVGFHVPEARVGLDLRGLLFGGSPVRRISLSEAEVRLFRDAEGAWHPAGLARLLGGPREEEPPRSRWWRRLEEGFGVVLRILVHRPPAIPSFEIERSRVEVRLAAPGSAGGEDLVRLSFEDLQLDLVRRLFGAGLHFEASSRITTATGERGRLWARGAIETRDSLDIELSADDLDLALLRPWARRLVPGSDLTGRSTGRVRWRFSKGEAHRLEGHGTLTDPRLDLPAALAEQPVALATSSAELSFDLAVDHAAARLHDASLKAGGIEFRAGGRVERPLGPHSKAMVAVRAWGIPVEPLREAAISLLPDPSHPLVALGRTLEGGRLASVSVMCPDLTLGHWRALRSLDPASWPPPLRVEIEVSELAARLPSEQRVTHLDGRIVATPRSVEVHTTRAELDGVPLARLDLMLEGLEHMRLPARPELAPVGTLPGRTPLAEWAHERRRPGSPSWTRAELQMDWIRHPLLFRALEDAKVVLTPTEGGLHAALSRGRWAGIPIHGEIAVVGGTPGAVAVVLRAESPGEARAPPDAERSAGDVWAQGRLRVELRRLGNFAAEWLEGTLRGRGERIDLVEAHAGLRPRGLLEGDLGLDLSHEAEVLVEVRLQFENGSLRDVLEGLGVRDSGLEGDLVAAGLLRGVLRPGTPLLAGLQGRLGAHARNGVLRRKLPVILALAEASDTLNPFPSRDELSYRALDAELEIDHGTVRALSLSLDGPTLRLVATGEIDAVAPERPLEAVVGVFFFRKLDAVINRVPLLNRLLLGADDNFVAAYFALDGPWEDPRARFIPVKSLTSGPGRVVIGLPSFVGSGVQRLQSLIVGGWKAGGEVLAPESKP